MSVEILRQKLTEIGRTHITTAPAPKTAENPMAQVLRDYALKVRAGNVNGPTDGGLNGHSQFSDIYESLGPQVYRYLYYSLPRKDLAEDLTQEVFVKAFEKLDTFKPRPNVPFRAWVFRIAHNHLIDHFRGQKIQPHYLGDEGSYEVQVITDPRKEADLNESLVKMVLDPAFGYLTPGQRKVVVLRFLEGMNIAETAEAVGKSVEAVKKLQARGLLALRRGLANQGINNRRMLQY